MPYTQEDEAEALQNALLLISETEKALKNGVLHYNKAGTKLTTVREILECLRDEGEILFKKQEASVG